MDLKRIVEANDTKLGRLFDLSIQALIALSVLSFSIETLPGLSEVTQKWLGAVEVSTVAVFTAEYLARIAVSDRKLGFIFSWWGLIDLAAILPFYMMSGLDLRSIRALRLLRLFRIFKLARYSRAVQRYHLAFKIAREEIVLYLAVALVLLYLTAVGIYYFENPAQPDSFASVFHALWWSVATLTTVGYGDVYPVTTGGKVFTSLILLIGLGVVAVPAGLMASALSKAREIQADETRTATAVELTGNGQYLL